MQAARAEAEAARADAAASKVQLQDLGAALQEVQARCAAGMWLRLMVRVGWQGVGVCLWAGKVWVPVGGWQGVGACGWQGMGVCLWAGKVWVCEEVTPQRQVPGAKLQEV